MHKQMNHQKMVNQLCVTHYKIPLTPADRMHLISYLQGLVLNRIKTVSCIQVSLVENYFKCMFNIRHLNQLCSHI